MDNVKHVWKQKIDAKAAEENTLTVLDVKEGNQHGEQSSHGNLTHQLPVAMVGTECQCAFAQVSQTLWRHKEQSIATCTNTRSAKNTCVWYRVPFVLPPTWASRTMKRLLGSLAWYCASCRSMAARRALFVPEEMEKMKSLLNMLRKSTLEAL